MTAAPVTGMTREVVIQPYSPWSLQPLHDLWDSRELIWILALRDIKVRYSQAVLGFAWAIAQPVAQVIIYTLLFHRFAGIRSGSALPYPVFCFSGLVVWMVFASGLSQASESLVSNANLVTKVYFPRAVLPIAATGSTLVDFTAGFLLLLPVAAWFHVPLSATVVLAPLIAIVAQLCAISVAFWTSAINLQYRDVRHALPFFMQMLVFATPVFYPSSLVPERWRGILALNPMSAVLETFRALAFGLPVPWGRLGTAVFIMVAVGVAGFIRFTRLERTFADRI